MFGITVVFALLVLAIILFASEWVSFDVTALIIMSILMVTGILTPSEGFAGFSNAATITIGAMFILSEGLRKTGILDEASTFFTSLGKQHFWLGLLFILLFMSTMSAFINNTAVVAIFIPVIVMVAQDLNMSPSKLLMPLSFASMFGGVCSLIGTSTNILVSSIAEDHQIEAFSMFEFLPLGIILLVVGFVYMFTVGINWIPDRRKGEELTRQFEMNEYLTDIILRENSDFVGKTIDESRIASGLDIDIIRVFKQRGDTSAQRSSPLLEAGDVLRIRGSAAEIDKLLQSGGIAIKPSRDWLDVDLKHGRDTIVEAVIAPESDLQNKPVRDIKLYDRFGAVPMAIRHHGRLKQEELGDIRLSGGDTILLNMDRERLPEIEQDPAFVLVSEVGLTRYQSDKTMFAIAVIAGVVLFAALDFAPIVITATVGAILMVLGGCLSTEEAYNAVNWKVIMLLAGVIPLGTAMDKTGAATMLSDFLINVVGEFGPMWIVSSFFFISMMLTNVISNQATAALLAPIAIQAASTMGVSARPFLMAVTFAASLSFMTPVGYQTNTLIYGPGQYKFRDFMKVGTPLNIILWIIATFAIPMIWPF